MKKTTAQILEEIKNIPTPKVDWDEMAIKMKTGLARVRQQSIKDLKEIESKMAQLTTRAFAKYNGL